MKIRILLISANPKDTHGLRIDKEFREIQDTLDKGKYRRGFTVISRSAIREQDLRELLISKKPHIIHFSGHSEKNGIYVEDDYGNSKFISNLGLANLIFATKSIHCVILNSCFSEEIAKSLTNHIPYVIGMESTIADELALAFSKGFYTYLSHNYNFEKAFYYGNNAIDLASDKKKHFRSLNIKPKELHKSIAKIFIGNKNLSIFLYNLLSSKITLAVLILTMFIIIPLYFGHDYIERTGCPDTQIAIHEELDLDKEVFKIEPGNYQIGKLRKSLRVINIKGFLMDRYEVTNKQYLKYIEKIRQTESLPSDWINEKPAPHLMMFPVSQVSWTDADKYCKSLGKRLPTAEEWEIACLKNEKKSNYHCRSLSSVGSYFSNTVPEIFNLNDNLSEWTQSLYPLQDSSSSKTTIIKGGNYQGGYEQCSTDAGITNEAAELFIGFRCVSDQS